MSTITEADVIVIGAGMAGASVAYFLAPHARVVVLEREQHAGVHSTGRSAALFSETYGSAQVRALSRATRPFLERPPEGFAQHPILSPRGTVIIGNSEQADAVQAMYEEMAPLGDGVRMVGGAWLRSRVPVLRPEAAEIGLFEPGSADIDVNELHQGFLRALRARGGKLRVNVAIRSIERGPGHWFVDAGDESFRAPLLVNAAGAWVDEVAALAGVAPIGIQPRRRSAFLFQPPSDVDTTHWPFVMDVEETFYFKPDAGLLMGCPANADPVSPHDVQPEELDIAMGIHRIEEATTMTIRRPTRTWAGLRSFVADGDLVGGFAPGSNDFFWVAAQGGYGIQTSAAMGEACAQLVLGHPLPAHLQAAGITAQMLDPVRLSR
ncbi:FAD-dependent oxidoreductase [Dyella jiangningensis]|uniref:NAD(P)/FAD-dependent oxidoreductase n=1 Tax=Dyella jiangningensis TaxID=1379159 RepID=UPI002410B436|nr:FAD-dependent oxidoreductase [Dyella jiangningensis]MDG2539149.1 FAD-dependent oxidoreductase [Dyella jiangningensis]